MPNVVHSFDLVACSDHGELFGKLGAVGANGMHPTKLTTHPNSLCACLPAVVACDIANVPLENEAADIAVFCLVSERERVRERERVCVCVCE